MNKLGLREPLLPGTKTEAVTIQNIPCEWVFPPSAKSAQVLLYLHGGGYKIGSILSHRSMVSRIAEACGMKALMPDYRLAPEYPYPAAVNDTLDVYKWLLDQFDPKNIVLAGDSAGGGLALASMLKAKDLHLPLPAALALLSPWVDLEMKNNTIRGLAHKDPILKPQQLKESADIYAGAENTKHPYISPLNGDLRNLPPILIHVGKLEIFLGEARELAQKAKQADVEVQFEIWNNMVHVWHFIGDRLPEARKAIRQIGIFVKKYVNSEAKLVNL